MVFARLWKSCRVQGVILLSHYARDDPCLHSDYWIHLLLVFCQPEQAKLVWGWAGLYSPGVHRHYIDCHCPWYFVCATRTSSHCHWRVSVGFASLVSFPLPLGLKREWWQGGGSKEG